MKFFLEISKRRLLPSWMRLSQISRDELHEVIHPRAGITARESDFVEYAPALFVLLSRSEQKAIQSG
jgi:hypothetical protein